jgi:hypothetical protein
MTLDPFALAFADFFGMVGGTTPDRFRAYLARRGMTPQQYLDDRARSAAETAALPVIPTPDAERDPVGYYRYVRDSDPRFGATPEAIAALAPDARARFDRQVEEWVRRLDAAAAAAYAWMARQRSGERGDEGPARA